MNNPAQSAQMAQIIRCEHGELTFAIDKADVLSIQRTERFNFLDPSDLSADRDWLSELEYSQDVIGWISDGVRKIPICQFEHGATKGLQPQEPSGYSDNLDESARVILFTPSTSRNGGDPQSMTPPWGVLIDRVQGVIEVRRTQFHATPPILMGSTPSSFNSIVRRDGEVLMVLDPHSVNPFRRYSTTADLIAFPPDDHHLARLAAAMQVSSKLPGIAGDKPGSRGLVTFSLEQDLGDGRDVSIGFSISQVAEILESASIIPVPKAPEYIGGLFFWRDIAVPIVDILARMGLSGAPPAEAERYIIVRHPLTTNGKDPSPTGTPKRLVFAALGINTDVRILRSPIASRPSSRSLPFKPGLIRSQVELETGTLVIPDLQALLTPQTA